MAATGVLVAVVAALAVLQLPPVATWLVRRFTGFVPLNPGYELEVGRVSGDWIHGLRLENVRLVRGPRELAAVARMRVGYDVRRLRRAQRLEELVVEGARVSTRREGQTWDLSQVLRRPADTTGRKPLSVGRIALRDVQLAAWLSPDSAVQVRSLTLLGHDLRLTSPLLLTIDDFSAAMAPPGTRRYFAVSARGVLAPEELRFDPLRIQTERTDIVGRAVLPRRFDEPRQVDRLAVRLEGRPLALADLAAVVPAVRPEGDVTFNAQADGQGRLITATLAAALDEATLELDSRTTLNRGRPASHRVKAEVRRLDPSRLLRSAPAGDLTGRFNADLRGSPLRESDGRVRLRLARSRLGGTALNRLDLDANLTGGRADLQVLGDLPAGELRARGWARPFDSLPSYRLTGTARRLPGTDAIARALAGGGGDPVLDLRFQFAGAGLGLREARATGRVDLAAARAAGERVALGHAELSLANGRLDARPDLLLGGGHVRAVATASLGDSAVVSVRRGAIDGVDLGRLMGDTIPHPVSGTFSAHYGGGLLRAGLDAGLAGGRLALDAETRPLDSTRAFVVRRASLDSVDLGALLRTPAIAGPITLTGDARGRWNPREQAVHTSVQLEPSRVGAMEIGGGRLRADLMGERLTYEADLAIGGGSLALAGDATPSAEVPAFAVRRGSAESLDLGPLFGVQGLATALNARFTASAAGRSADSMRADLVLDLLPSTVNGAGLDSGRTTLHLEGGTVRGDVHAAGRDGALDTKVSGTLSGARGSFAVEGGARLERLARWTGRREADGRLESRFALHVSTDSAGLRSLDGSATAAGAVGAVRLDPVHVVLAPDTGAIRVDTLIVRSNVALLDGRGRVALRDSARADTLRLAGGVFDPAPLASLFGSDTVSLDSARVTLALTGTARRRVASANADMHRVFFAGNLAEHATLRAASVLDGFTPAGVTGELTMNGAAYGRVRIPEAKVTARYDSVVALEATATLQDSIHFAARARGTVQGDTVRAAIERLDLAQWSLSRPARVVAGPRLEVDRLQLQDGRRRIALAGVLDRRGRSDLRLELDSVDLDVLNELGFAPIPGLMDGSLRLSGTASALSLAGKLGLVVRERGGTRQVGRMGTELDWTAEGLRINAVAAANEGGFLTVNGTLPIRFGLTPADTIDIDRGTGQAVNLRALSDSFGLAFFNPLLPPEVARDLKGRLELDMRFGGSLDAPSADGGFALDSAGMTLPALRVTYDRGTARGRLAGDRLSIQQARFFTGKNESLTASGTALLRPLDDPALDLTAELRNFRVSNSKELRSLASGRVRLGGTVVKPVLAGKVRLGRTDLFVGTQAAAMQVEEVELTPEDMRQLARYFGPAAIREAKDSPGLIERFRLNLDVEMPQQIWVRRRQTPKMDIELSGRVNLRQEPGRDMEFFGQVEPVPDRSSIDISGREFRITSGDVFLEGPVEAARLDVSAEYQVPAAGDADDEGVVITVHAVGHPDSLALTFGADPSMNREDIVSYIVTGRPASDNPLSGRETGGGSLGEQVAFGALADAVSTRAGEGLGFDVFQIRQEGTRGLTLTAGRYLASRWFLDLQLPLQLGSDARNAAGTNLGPGFELEYTVRRWLRAGLRGGSISPGFTLRGRYAY
jgi:autotransporter translocation and assembly factor TamB